ncbi:hypothetical protein FQA39_LY15885 [Lamprigera yunnana]|nr:hypothetical protein FQA39_LY15885 [Lamprigera yunnana]
MSKSKPPVEVSNVKESSSKVHYKDFFCGWGAACISITITYPINKLIFRQILSSSSVYTALKEMYHEGIFQLYRGIFPPLMQKTFSLSIMFGVYEEVRRPLMEKSNINPYGAKMIAGLTAGTMEAILMPFERIQTLLVDTTYNNRFKNTFHAFKIVGTNYGIRECYRGLIPILFRNGPSSVCFFVLRDEFHIYIHKSNSVLGQKLSEFFCGALIGVLISGIFFPLNVLKVHMQSQIGGEFQSLYQGVKQVYQRGGTIKNFYYGVQVSMIRSFFGWGIVNAAYEYLRSSLKNF